MLTVALNKSSKQLEQELGKYLFKIRCDVYVGNVTRRVFEYLKQTIIELLAIEDNEVKMCFKNNMVASGIEMVTIRRDGIKKDSCFDGVFDYM